MSNPIKALSFGVKTASEPAPSTPQVTHIKRHHQGRHRLRKEPTPMEDPPALARVPWLKLTLVMAIILALHGPTLWTLTHGLTITNDQAAGLMVLNACTVWQWFTAIRHLLRQTERVELQADKIYALTVRNSMLRTKAPTRPIPVQTANRTTQWTNRR